MENEERDLERYVMLQDKTLATVAEKLNSVQSNINDLKAQIDHLNKELKQRTTVNWAVIVAAIGISWAVLTTVGSYIISDIKYRIDQTSQGFEQKLEDKSKQTTINNSLEKEIIALRLAVLEQKIKNFESSVNVIKGK